MREEVKTHLKSILISQKAKNKVTTRNVNHIKRKGKEPIRITQETPRGQLHKETVYAQKQQYQTLEIKLGPKTRLAEIHQISNMKIRNAVLERLSQFNQDPELAFGGKNALKKSPIWLDQEQKYAVPEKVKITQITDIYTIRKAVSPDLKLDKVVDNEIRKILQRRLDDFNGNPKAAFVDLEKNPIWFDKDKTIQIKKVKITGVSNARALHFKKDHYGNFITDERGMRIPTDFVSLGNNHHIGIYLDQNGKYQEEVVPFFEAVRRKNAKEPVVQKVHPHGWEFVFSLKQNEYFVFPSEDFDPKQLDLCDPANNALISPHLYRVQKIASTNYVFRHHLETSVTNDIKEITFKSIRTPGGLSGLVKVRINHLGEIVQQGLKE
jgi:CRISPR-associated endonuclease Csn1